MGLFDKQKNQDGNKALGESKRPLSLLACANMRVEVTAFDGHLLFVAKLMNPKGNKAELYQFFEANVPQNTESLHVRIRGYHDHQRKAVYMEGVITPGPHHIWQVDELTVARIGNERSFFRLDTDIPATATTFSAGADAGERPCRLLNISVGGAGISSEHRYWKGDKFLLTVQLEEDRETSLLFCEVLRVIEKDGGKYEYGCRFLELSESDQDKIAKNIFSAHRKSLRSSV